MDYNLNYQDLLGSEGPEYTTEPYSYESQHPIWSYTGESNSIDPYLDALPPHGGYLTQHQHHNLHHLRGSFTAYDPAAHGFCLPYQRNSQETEPYQLGICSPPHGDLIQFRDVRQMSPPDSSGFAASSTESTTSEYALSPDFIRTPYEMPMSPQDGDLYRGTTMGTPFNVANNWNPQATIVTSLPMSIPSSQTALRMRDLQVTPDPVVEDDFMEDRDVLQPKLNPEELELSEHLNSPADSGLGRSIPDEETITVKDEEEEDSGAIESDNDSEFIPGGRRSARGSAGRLNRGDGVNRRLSGARRSSTTKGVLGQQSRVTKNSNARKTVLDHSRAKSKKVTSRSVKNTGKKSEQPTKSFPCTFHHYGCMSTFASKNEWKRHVASQHLRLGYYRCDLGSCSPEDSRSQQRGFNDFNRKDLFTQHCRRMHAPWSGSKKGEDGVSKKEKDSFEKQLEHIRARCWIDRRKAPIQSSCGFCGESFVDSEDGKAWDARMEHIGRHFERDSYSLDEEDVDTGLRDWSIKEGVIVPGRRKGEWWLVDHEPAVAPRTPANRRRSGRLVVRQEEEAQEEEAREEDISDTSDDDDINTDSDADAEAEQDDVEMPNGIDAEEDDDEDAEGEEE